MTSIAIDAMGGDFGCEPIVSGVISALKEREFHAFLGYPDFKFTYFLEVVALTSMMFVSPFSCSL